MRFNKIPIARPSYSNYHGTDMYGTSVRVKPHFTRSLYSKFPIYESDVNPYGYPYGYMKPQGGGGIWAADGISDKDAWISDCVKKKLAAIPAGMNFVVDPAIGIKINCEKEWNDKNSQSSSSAKISPANTAVIVGGIIGAVAGYFTAQSNNKNSLLGILIGGVAVAGVVKLFSSLSPEEKKMNASGKRNPTRQELINSLSSQYSIDKLRKLNTAQLRQICCKLKWECCWDSI